MQMGWKCIIILALAKNMGTDKPKVNEEYGVGVPSKPRNITGWEVVVVSAICTSTPATRPLRAL